MKFLDFVKIYIRSGKGGNGAVSFRREKYVEYGGPDGGNGGCGGDVIAVATEGLNTLVDFRYQQHFFAKDGAQGMGRQRTGANGQPITLKVPVGTEILDEDQKTTIADLSNVGASVILAKGGNGGFGNYHFRSATNQAPRHANPGLLGIERTLWLRLKLVADVGLVGLPNAGKSTLLSASSNARPKIADYPFTTLHPNLGLVSVDGREFTMADIPGLISGASEGRGLGHRFLGHIERCPILLHLIDGLSPDIETGFEDIRNELCSYGCGLEEKPIFVAVNKIDAMDAELRNSVRERLKDVMDGARVFEISGVSGEGVKELLRALGEYIRDYGMRAGAGNQRENEEQEKWTP